MLIMILIVRAFNNYVDPDLSNFDPHPLEWTKIVILHTCHIHKVYVPFFHMTQQRLFLQLPHPLFFSTYLLYDQANKDVPI